MYSYGSRNNNVDAWNLFCAPFFLDFRKFFLLFCFDAINFLSLFFVLSYQFFCCCSLWTTKICCWNKMKTNRHFHSLCVYGNMFDIIVGSVLNENNLSSCLFFCSVFRCLYPIACIDCISIVVNEKKCKLNMAFDCDWYLSLVLSIWWIEC